MKLASGSGDLSELDPTSFFAQGQEYLDAGDLRDSLLKRLLIEEQSHPLAVDSYTEAFRSSQDALGKLVHDLSGFVGSAKLWVDEQLRRSRD